MRERFTRRNLALVAAILLLALPLLLLLRGFTRVVILTEVMRYAWGVRLLFESLPQIAVWIVFLIVASLVVMNSLIQRIGTDEESHKVTAERPGRIHDTCTRIERAAEGEYFGWRLAHYVRTVTLEVHAHQYRVPVQQIEQDLDAGRLQVPPEVHAYLSAGLSPSFSRSGCLFPRLRRYLSSRIRDAAVDPKLEQVVEYLEDQLKLPPLSGPEPRQSLIAPLEVRHDYRSHKGS